MLYIWLVGCGQEGGMNKDQFWRIADLAVNRNNLRNELLASDPKTVLGYYMQFLERMRESDTGDLWAVAMLLNAGHCSDDCFEYFRCWLISQGRSTFERALANPDVLAEIEIPYSNGKPSAQDEDFYYIAHDVYKKRTGEDLYKALRRLNLSAVGNNSITFDWQEYTNEVIKTKFPTMWKKYSTYYNVTNEIQNRVNDITTKVDILGVGSVGVGDSLRHIKYGVGVVKTISPGSPHAALIQFPDSERSIILDAKYVGKENEIDRNLH
jgi:hypothetical protein